MARTWLSVTVELLGGRGEEPWPWPGRIFAVGPSHTFMDLANAINDAFARWDRSHLSVFTLADGRMVSDVDTGAEMAASIGGPLLSPLDIDSAKMARTVTLGEEFQFTFDLGDEWVHRRVPPRPATRHPMVTHDWPAGEFVPALDLVRLRQAMVARDADAVLDAVRGRDIDDALQQVGLALGPVLDRGLEVDHPTVPAVINRLTWRARPGDRELAEDLLAPLPGEPLPGRVVPVDLDGSRDGWQDMADFAARQHDGARRDRLERAIEGRGAFRRFRDLVHDEGLADQWEMFSTDRQWGRAREFLADSGIRVGPRGAGGNGE